MHCLLQRDKISWGLALTQIVPKHWKSQHHVAHRLTHDRQITNMYLEQRAFSLLYAPYVQMGAYRQIGDDISIVCISMHGTWAFGEITTNDVVV